MAEARRDDRGGRNQKNRGGGGGPRVLVTGLEIGNPKAVGVGEFDVPLNVLLLNGKDPAHGAQYQFIVDGKPFGPPQLVDISGRAEGILRLSGKKSVPISLHVKWRDLDFRPFLKNVDLPEQLRSLVVLGTAKRNDIVEVVLRRVGKDGKGEVGDISVWDWRIENGKPEWKFLGWEVKDTDGYVSIFRPMLDDPRKVSFFLPDDIEVKAEVNIPAKKSRTSTKKKKEPETETWAQKLKKSREGEKPGDSLRERIKKQYKENVKDTDDVEETDEVRAEKARVVNDGWTMK